MATKQYKRFPRKPSRLLSLAIDSLLLASTDKRLEIDMAYYHIANDRRICKVCLAGAVMHYNLPVPSGLRRYGNISVSDYSEDITDRLLALDWFRTGDVVNACYRILPRPIYRRMYSKLAKLDREMPSYRDEFPEYIQKLRDIVSDLQKLGY